jgi:hypothetical protein
MPTIIKKILTVVSLAVLGLISTGVNVLLIIVFLCGATLYLSEKTDLLAGITYPKKWFAFHNICDGKHSPCDTSTTFGADTVSPETFSVTIYSSERDSKLFARARICAKNKPHNVLHIKEVGYEYEGNRGVFLKQQSFRQPTVIPGCWSWHLGGEFGDIFRCDLFECNFEKLFPGKEQGDEFKFSLVFIYSFDDEPENIQRLEYNVKVYKGKYIPFQGF